MTLKKIFLNFSLLLSLLSCSTSEFKNENLNEVREPYRTSGVEQFFLPELPGWANSSESGNCFKSNSFQYIDFAKVHSNYNLRYSEILELQAQYNKRREDYFRSTAYRFLRPVEETSFFNNTLQEVRGGVKLLQLPETPIIDLVWLENILEDEKGLQVLTELNASGAFDDRPVILFSSCLSLMRMKQWIMENGLEDVGFFIISAEWLTPYKKDFSLRAGMKIEISEVVGDSVIVNIINTKDKSKISIREISF